MKPLCRLCGERHWSGEDHVWKEGDIEGGGRAEVTAEAGESVEGPDVSSIGGVGDEVKVLTPQARWNRRNRERVRAYQREYMRNRRK